MSAEFVGSGNGQGWRSKTIRVGKCTTAPSLGSGRFNVYGHKSPSKFHVGSLDYKKGQSRDITAVGSSANPDLVVNGPGGGTFVKN
ncbi:hypothetical protein [Streptomyces sp. NPDC048172]|uniref:hypothetical protein n=1 Tax=Streptomyces sp. NPDC048172 TaxID=3365505 RepID=UPI00371D2049